MKINAEDLMQDRKLKTRGPQNNDKIKLMIVLIAIVITIIIISIIIVLLKNIKPIDMSLKVYIDGEKTQVSNNTFLFEGDKVYINVRDFATRIGYTAHNGEYKIEAEDSNKIFIENKNETASIFLNSTIISKIEPNLNGEYKNYEMSEPAREQNGEIYIISDGMEIAGNIDFLYDSKTNTIQINGLDYLYEEYKKAIINVGYTELSDNFENKKAILYDKLVVKNSDDKYGVIDLQGNEVIGTRYSKIQFDEYTQEFIITNQSGKMGIDFITGETKIEVGYDEIRSIHKVNQLYVVKNNDKYGIIDKIGKIVIHLEYDDIGVDLAPFINSMVVVKNTSTTNSTNTGEEKQYIFFDKLIPVKQKDKYGFFDINGKQISELKYSGIGCYAEKTVDKNGKTISENKKSTNNILTIDDYELLIVKGDNGYGIVDTDAKEIVDANATDIYYVVNAGIESYYMVYKGKQYNLITDVFERLNLKSTKQIEESNNERVIERQHQEENVVNVEKNNQEANNIQEENQTTNAQSNEQETTTTGEQTQEIQNESSEQEEGN